MVLRPLTHLVGLRRLLWHGLCRFYASAVVYYNDNDPKIAAWLRELIHSRLLPTGTVDERSIADVQPAELKDFAQCHFFAGIGGWAYALQLARWPEDRPVWTGSCPCQPFSAAGRGQGADDPRHLWPDWFRLIRECRPPVVFGEQVEAAIRHGWLDTVFRDLEGAGYACGVAVLGAHSVGVPHIRQRLWFVADAEHPQRRTLSQHREDGRDRAHGGRPEAHGQSGARGEICSVDDATGARRNSAREETKGQARDETRVRGPQRRCGAGELGHPSSARLAERERHGRVQRDALEPQAGQAALGRGHADLLGNSASWRCEEPPQQDGETPENPADGHPRGPDVDRPSFWSSCDWLPCRDNKSRPVEPGTFPLAHGVPARMGRLRGYGNAIVPQVAEAFIRAYLDICEKAP